MTASFVATPTAQPPREHAGGGFCLQDIRKSTFRENLGFPFIYLYKIVAGRLGNSETWLRTLYRLGFTFVAPGFTSHFPCDYERKLRQQLENPQSSDR